MRKFVGIRSRSDLEIGGFGRTHRLFTLNITSVHDGVRIYGNETVVLWPRRKTGAKTPKYRSYIDNGFPNQLEHVESFLFTSEKTGGNMLIGSSISL